MQGSALVLPPIYTFDQKGYYRLRWAGEWQRLPPPLSAPAPPEPGWGAARFARAGRPGIYFRVEEPGTVQAGDALTLLEAAATTVTIHEISQLLRARTVEASRLADVLALPHLPAEVRRQLISI